MTALMGENAIRRAWAMVGPEGIDIETLTETESTCIAHFEQFYDFRWHDAKNDGWTCIEVEIRPISPPAQDAGLLREARDTLEAVRKMCADHPALQAREYISLGIQTNNIVRKLTAHLTNAEQTK